MESNGFCICIVDKSMYGLGTFPRGGGGGWSVVTTNKGWVTNHSPLLTLYIMGVHANFKQALQAYESWATVMHRWKIVKHHQEICNSIIVVDFHLYFNDTWYLLRTHVLAVKQVYDHPLCWETFDPPLTLTTWTPWKTCSKRKILWFH